jgi:hypothetical protein
MTAAAPVSIREPQSAALRSDHFFTKISPHKP